MINNDTAMPMAMSMTYAYGMTLTRFQTMKHGFKSIAYQGSILWNFIPSHK